MQLSDCLRRLPMPAGQTPSTRKYLVMSLQHWFRSWSSRPGFPDNYFVFDFETTGVEHGVDLIVQVGYCHVRDRCVVANEGFMLDWTSDGRVPADWLAARIATTKRHVEVDRSTGAPSGKHYPFSVDRLREEGLPPGEVLETFLRLLESSRRCGEVFVGHNAWSYDAPMWSWHSSKFLGHDFVFRPDDIFDTGMMEKASQLGLLPAQGESMRDFAVRVYHARPFKRWSLDRHAIPKYGLDVKYGLDPERAHHADFDCLATHCLFQEFRMMSEQVPEVAARG